MHYIIAKEILKEESFDKNLFVLGNLAPDAHDGTLRGNSCAHFRKIISNDYDIYPNIDLGRFKEQYINDKVDDFTIGYYCHLISDYTWVKSIYPKYLEFTMETEKNNIQRQSISNDFTILNSILSAYYNICFEQDMNIPEQLNIKEFSHERLIPLLHNLMDDFQSKHTECNLKIFNMDFILDYINEAVCNCNQELEHINQRFHIIFK